MAYEKSLREAKIVRRSPRNFPRNGTASISDENYLRSRSRRVVSSSWKILVIGMVFLYGEIFGIMQSCLSENLFLIEICVTAYPLFQNIIFVGDVRSKLPTLGIARVRNGTRAFLKFECL